MTGPERGWKDLAWKHELQRNSGSADRRMENGLEVVMEKRRIIVREQTSLHSVGLRGRWCLQDRASAQS